MQSFKELALPEVLEQALAAMSYQKPTPIQAQAIPPALLNRDIMGCAQTGTGKTAAFGIPLVAALLKTSHKSALVLVPTRELALQVEEVLGKLVHFSPTLKTVVLIGGASMNAQTRALRSKPRIVVATPGRLVDHLRQGNLTLSNAEVLVLDEADRMLDMGFLPQLNQVLRYLPRVRQTMLFSATFPNDLQKLAGKYLKEPVKVTVGTVSKPAAKIKQSTIQATIATKNDVLMDELNARNGSVLIFARTKRRTDKLARVLTEYGFKAGRIHGDRSQKQRQDAIDGFRDGKFKILVATDIAARGLDIPHIAHVINYDLPMTPEEYVHRIGRTARAGAEGNAVSLLTPEDRGQWKQISRHLERV